MLVDVVGYCELQGMAMSAVVPIMRYSMTYQTWPNSKSPSPQEREKLRTLQHVIIFYFSLAALIIEHLFFRKKRHQKFPMTYRSLDFRRSLPGPLWLTIKTACLKIQVAVLLFCVQCQILNLIQYYIYSNMTQLTLAHQWKDVLIFCSYPLMKFL